MADQYVRCSVCGQFFNISAGGRFDTATSHFFCPACAALIGPPVKKITPPSTGKTVGLLIGGGIFLAFGFSEAAVDLSSLLFGLAIGLPLFLWGVLPWVSYYKAKRREEENRQNAQQDPGRIRFRQEQKKGAPKICPSCGATSYGDVCEYCGTKL